MKTIAFFLMAIVISASSFSQSDDIPIDESLIVKLASTASGGYLSKMDLKRAKTLEVNEREAVIVSFDYFCTKQGYEASMHNDGPELSQEILNHLNSLKIGTKVSFENIRIENASGEVMAKPLLLTVKS